MQIGFTRFKVVGLLRCCMRERSAVTGLYSTDLVGVMGSVHEFERLDHAGLTREVRGGECLSMDAAVVSAVETAADRGRRVCDVCGVGYQDFADGVGRRSRRWFELESGEVCGGCARDIVDADR